MTTTAELTNRAKALAPLALDVLRMNAELADYYLSWARDTMSDPAASSEDRERAALVYREKPGDAAADELLNRAHGRAIASKPAPDRFDPMTQEQHDDEFVVTSAAWLGFIAAKRKAAKAGKPRPKLPDVLRKAKRQ